MGSKDSYCYLGQYSGKGFRGLFAALLVFMAIFTFSLSPLFAQVDEETEAAFAEEENAEEEAADGLLGMLAEQDLGFSYEIYQVRAGDTVENIAARFGVAADRIRQFNGLDETELTKGQSLAIPLPTKSGAKQTAPPEPTLNLLEPCYAIMTSASPILSTPGDMAGGEVLYEPQLGTQLIVNAERGDYWGIVMVDGSAGWVPKSCLKMTDHKIPPDRLEQMLAGGRPEIVQEARRYLGTPYRYGGSLPHNVDCSLLVQTVFRAKGINLPRTAAQQYEVGRVVHYSEMLPGDRIYFVSKSGRINHTGIYMGNGLFIHASSRRGCVAIDALYDRVFWTRFIGARRS